MICDVYGVEGNRRRHPKCTCEVPCQGRYRCEHPNHRGNRSTPWCSGGTDEPWCDDCWAAAMVGVA